MICLTKDAVVSTTGGRRRVAELREGDQVITSNGTPAVVQVVRRRVLTGRDLLATPHLKPIMIRVNAFGEGMPSADLMVSPNQRVRVARERTALKLREAHAFVSAKHLIDHDGVFEISAMSAEYVQIEFRGHQTICLNGLWVEVFQPVDWSLGSHGNAQRTEIYELFPIVMREAARARLELDRPVGKKKFLFF